VPGKITKDLSDGERFELLKNRALTVAPCDPARAEAVRPGILVELAEAGRSQAFPLLETLCREFGIIGEERKRFENATVALAFPQFEYSSRALLESTRKQGTKDFSDMAKMFTCFDSVIKNAVGVEAHGDRYGDERSLDSMFVLTSAFHDGDRIVPVKLEVKSLKDAKPSAPNTLYVAVARSAMQKAAWGGRRVEGLPSAQSSMSDLAISIRDFFANVNSLDGDLLKYIPSGFLNPEQLAAATAAQKAEAAYVAAKENTKGENAMGYQEVILRVASDKQLKFYADKAAQTGLLEPLAVYAPTERGAEKVYGTHLIVGGEREALSQIPARKIAVEADGGKLLAGLQDGVENGFLTQTSYGDYAAAHGITIAAPKKAQPAPEAKHAELTAAPASAASSLTQLQQNVVKQIVENLESGGTLTWRKGWDVAKVIESFGAPQNALSGATYNGINALWLAMKGAERGYADPRWLTFNQMRDKGLRFGKDAKGQGVPIEFTTLYDKTTKTDFDKSRPAFTAMQREEQIAYFRENVRRVVKQYTVFNATLVDGIEPYKVTPGQIAERNAAIEGIIAHSAAPVSFDGGDRAYYSPSSDSIHLPPRAAFADPAVLYGTALHEIGHSTGAQSRLARDLSGRPGTESYAQEELVAELSSALCQATYGVTLSPEHIQNHAAYIQHWQQLLTDKPEALAKAIKEAGKVYEYVNEHYALAASENTKEKVDEPQLSPIVAQYKAAKAQNPDAVVLLRVGDFYEMMYVDAELAAKTLDLTLTTRDVSYISERGGTGERAPMCGVPFHTVDKYIQRLIETGHKVAVVEPQDIVAQTAPVAQPAAQLAQTDAERKAYFKTVNERLTAIERNTPQALKEKPNWVMYRTLPDKADPSRRDKYALCPFDIAPAQLTENPKARFAKAKDPTTWRSFGETLAYARKKFPEGLSFMLDGTVSCIDLDKCLDGQGKPNALAQSVLDKLPGVYCERSVSGHGLHFFFPGDISADGKYKSESNGIEAYARHKPIAMTGNIYDGRNAYTPPPQDSIDWLHMQLGQRLAARPAPSGVPADTSYCPGSRTDAEVLDEIARSKNGEAIMSLYKGNRADRNNNADDFRLMLHLAYFTGKDVDQAVRLFETSGLYRGSGKGSDYVRHSVEKACTIAQQRTYAPKSDNFQRARPPRHSGNGNDSG
jgi:antirestriction protein ArdC